MEEQRQLIDTQAMHDQCQLEKAELSQITSFLSQNSKFRSAAMTAAQAGWWYWDVIDDTLFWDPEMYAIYGRSQENWTPNYGGFSECLHPDDRPKVEQSVNDCLHNGAEYFYRFRVIDDEGLIRHIEGRGGRLLNGDDKPIAMAGVCIQIPPLVP